MAGVTKLTTKIAAKSLARQASTLTRADDIGAAADRLVSTAWQHVVSTLQSIQGHHHAFGASRVIHAILEKLGLDLVALIGNHLQSVAEWSHDHTAQGLVDHVPLHRLAASAVAPLREAKPGLLDIGLTRRNQLKARQRVSAAMLKRLSDEQKKKLLRELIFPPPTQQQAFGVIYAGDWQSRLLAETKLAGPHEIATAVMHATIEGKSINELAKGLMPVVQNVKATARRIARDETMRVAHTMQWRAWQEVDDLIAGYQVFAVDRGHNPTSRLEHKARHGTVYYIKPGPGQHGIDELPHPPQEADGSTAYNCRCWITPVFHSEESDPHADEASGALDMDMAHQWFDQASERDRRAAVGAGVYNQVQQQFGRRPEWKDFVDSSGRMLPF